jgi:hypothetical protein
MGFAFVTFILGAAVMYFDLPPAGFMGKAFMGARAWFTWATEEPPPPPLHDVPVSEVLVDKPERTFDGYTLYSTTRGSWAVLLNMNGTPVHHWAMPFSQGGTRRETSFLPFPAHDDRVNWFRCHVFPNGDLLAIYHAIGDTPYGYGLVKLDKNSRLLWSYGGNVHHDLDVDEDGRIYILTHHVVENPPAGVTAFRGSYLADELVVLSPTGTELERIPLVEAFRDSPFATTLNAINNPDPDEPPQPGGPAAPLLLGDITHANSVKVLGASHAPAFRQFKAGQVLISFRTMDTLAVVDVPSRKVVWASGGPWRRQHDAEFLENGHLLIYDNLGTAKGARVLEYNPLTERVDWSCGEEGTPQFTAPIYGTNQRLPNGNTLILEPSAARMFEVTVGKKTVWECVCRPLHANDRKDNLTLTGARRYAASELTFLKGKTAPRP